MQVHSPYDFEIQNSSNKTQIQSRMVVASLIATPSKRQQDYWMKECCSIQTIQQVAQLSLVKWMRERQQKAW
jgi:hypothetical protein